MEQRTCATVIAGPNVLFREGLIRILGTANFQILWAVSCVDNLVLESLAEYDPVLFILDASEDLNAVLEQIKLIKIQHPTWRVVVLDNNHQLTDAASVYRAGASAYFVKVANSVAFIKFLELVVLGETILPVAFLPFVLGHERCDACGGSHRDDGTNAYNAELKEELSVTGVPMRQLSPREKTILRCIIEGCSNKSIARKVTISEATVKVHVKSILRKIGVHSRTQAAIWGMSCGSSIWEIDNGLAQISIQPSAPQTPIPALPRAVRNELSLLGADARKSS
jgi:two-component system, NarL family, nitrate/nitrite response regulator NarL